MWWTTAVFYEKYRPLTAAPGAFAYERMAGRERVVVVLNMSDREDIATLQLSAGANATGARLLLGTHRSAQERIDLATLVLHPFEVVVTQPDSRLT